MSILKRWFERPASDDRSASTDVPDAQSIEGERSEAPTYRRRSMQSRLANFLSLGFIAALTLGLLAWYYSTVFSTKTRSEDAVARRVATTETEQVLPSIGRIDPPVVEQVLGPPPAPPPETLPLTFGLPHANPHAVSSEPTTTSVSPGVSQPVPIDDGRQRRLAGPVFVSALDNQSSTPPGTNAQSGHANANAGGSGGGDIGDLLQATTTDAVVAHTLPTQKLILPKGAPLSCTLETAIDTSLPGLTTCVTATDAYSADGTVVLMERGTQLTGETRRDVRLGSKRVFVLWTQARTPTGVVIPLASPGTDEFGRSGLPGQVDRHFMDRFGAAILLSVVDGVIQSAVQRATNDGAIVVNPSGSRDVMTEILRETINIPPTLTKANGDAIAVIVARDLDFRSVYQLRLQSAR
jgi:type IV secretion system protein VirB10